MTSEPGASRTGPGAGWRVPLLPAVVVAEGSAGFPAAAVALRMSFGDEAMILFATCMVVAGLVEMVLVPG